MEESLKPRPKPEGPKSWFLFWGTPSESPPHRGVTQIPNRTLGCASTEPAWAPWSGPAPGEQPGLGADHVHFLGQQLFKGRPEMEPIGWCWQAQGPARCRSGPWILVCAIQLRFLERRSGLTLSLSPALAVKDMTSTPSTFRDHV